MTNQSFYDKIKALGVEDDVSVDFKWEEGCDVFHYNETHIEDAMSNTGAASVLAEAITEGVFYEKGNSILEEMRDEGLLEEYERGDEAFTDFVCDVINEEHYNYDWIENSTERFDHKRGWTDLALELSIPLGDLKGQGYNPLPSWTASVRTPAGYMTLDA
tara:strand:+ start:296 stop:775 length:480 start_codon:yes stop_codon:yes gene_type:complete